MHRGLNEDSKLGKLSVGDLAWLWLGHVLLDDSKLPAKSKKSNLHDFLNAVAYVDGNFLSIMYLLSLLTKASCCTYQHLDCTLGQSLISVLSLVACLKEWYVESLYSMNNNGNLLFLLKEKQSMSKKSESPNNQVSL